MSDDDRDQTAWLETDEVDDEAPDLTPTEIYLGELQANTRSTGGVESLTQDELREGETANPSVAAEEGLTWVPPIDPPTVPSPDDPQGVEIAAGFGASAISEPYDNQHPTSALADEDELSARVREALRADSATSAYADSLAIAASGRTVALRGLVDEVDDSDNVVEVASRVSGIDEVIDELDVRALEEG